jgi:hypothetical protein
MHAFHVVSFHMVKKGPGKACPGSLPSETFAQIEMEVRWKIHKKMCGQLLFPFEPAFYCIESEGPVFPARVYAPFKKMPD